MCVATAQCMLFGAMRANSEALLVQAAAVRQDGIRLVELVHRTGSLAPWLYLPPVIALAMDTSPVVSDKALGILKYCASKAVRPLRLLAAGFGSVQTVAPTPVATSLAPRVLRRPSQCT